MSKSPTPALDAIAAHGNRGHHGHLPNNIIICNDGTTFSVIAGNGTFSIPSPPRCECNSAGEAVVDSDSLSCDYLGPYQGVEVYTDDDELLEYGGYDPSGRQGRGSVLRRALASIRHQPRWRVQPGHRGRGNPPPHQQPPLLTSLLERDIP